VQQIPRTVAAPSVSTVAIPDHLDPRFAQQVVQNRRLWDGFGIRITTGDPLPNLCDREFFGAKQRADSQFQRTPRLHTAGIKL
jgi:hypothetical protein